MLRSVFDEWKVNLKTTLPCNYRLDPRCVFFIIQMHLLVEKSQVYIEGNQNGTEIQFFIFRWEDIYRVLHGVTFTHINPDKSVSWRRIYSNKLLFTDSVI